MSDWLNALNPLHHTTSSNYTHFWQVMFSTILEGFWGRLFAFIFLILSFWFGVRRRNIMIGVVLFGMSLLITIGAPLMRTMGLLW
jgi:hypothetical protein